jgi:hypothetical protein
LNECRSWIRIRSGPLRKPLKLFIYAIYTGDEGPVTMSASDITYKITDLNTNLVLALGGDFDYTINASTRFVTFYGSYATGSHVYRISCTYSGTFITNLTAAGFTIPDHKVQWTDEVPGTNPPKTYQEVNYEKVKKIQEAFDNEAGLPGIWKKYIKFQPADINSSDILYKIVPK